MQKWAHPACQAVLVAAALTLAAWFGSGCSREPDSSRLLKTFREDASYPDATILYPPNNALIPPDMAPCTFHWDDQAGADSWLVRFEFADLEPPLDLVCRRTEWTPDLKTWGRIKKRSTGATAKFTVLGFKTSANPQVLSRAQALFSTSTHPVEAPIFYREVNLPFLDAVKDPTKIRWRFGTVSSLEPPKVVLEHLPVCGNCHSFSRDGSTLGMDVDYANNKGSYIITKVRKQMALASSEIMTWDDFRPEDHQKTYGLLSQVSPDGQAVVSTVQDKSVFAARPDLAFSQLFFPIQGILAVYRAGSRTFASLPGAHDPAYVQSNPSWSPDGKYILFARARAYQLKNQSSSGKLLLSEEDCGEFLKEGRPFQFDIYRVPFNDGAGGKPEPLEGASRNGKSNYFPKYSPDGKWIVFCQARSYMLLQPDSELYIIPSQGGAARRLACNTGRMNSWHSWSPNSRWLVFSSKANSPFTQLFLTHIDEAGESSPPLVLARFTEPDRAANIPEFVNTTPGAIARIQEKFLNDVSYARAAYAFETSGDLVHAIAQYEQALKINPRNAAAHQRLGRLLHQTGKSEEQAQAHTIEALRLDPADARAQYDLGMLLHDRGRFSEALEHLAEAVRLLPRGAEAPYDAAEMRCNLAGALLATQQPQKAEETLRAALVVSNGHARTHYLLAFALAVQNRTSEAEEQYWSACAADPAVDRTPELHLIFSMNYEREGEIKKALAAAQKGLSIARQNGSAELIRAMQDRVDGCRQHVRSSQ